MQKTGFLVATTAIGLVLGLTQAQGAGFKINETRTTANATAGAAAMGGDLTTMWNNPATMTSLDGHQFAFNGAFIIPNTKFKKGSGTTATLTGNNGGNGGEFAFVPAVYGMWSVQDNMKVGLALTVPFGLATKYDKTWVGRFHSVHSELKTLNINPNVAYKINDMWSVGLGVSFQYADATIEKQINNASFGGAGEANSKVTGDDWGAGFNVGLMFEPMKGTRLGLAYRSKVTHGLRGKINNTGLTAGAAALGLVNGATKVSGDLTTPESVDFSFSQDLGEAWTVLGSVVWTRWNRFNELGFKSQATGATVGVVERQGWKNVFMFSLGADWKFAKDWVAHAGVAYDQSPISNEHRGPRLPGGDRTWLATGLDWSVTDWAKVGLSYTYIFVKDAKVNNVNGVSARLPGGNRLQGKFESDIHIIGVNANFKF